MRIARNQTTRVTTCLDCICAKRSLGPMWRNMTLMIPAIRPTTFWRVRTIAFTAFPGKSAIFLSPMQGKEELVIATPAILGNSSDSKDHRATDRGGPP